MKKFLLKLKKSLPVLFLYSSLLAQTDSLKIDSLLNKARHSDGKLKIDLLNEAASKAFPELPGLSAEKALEALKSAEAINYSEGIARASEIIARADERKKNYAEASEYFSNAAENYDGKKFPAKKAEMILKSADMLENLSRYDEALTKYQTALKLFEAAGDSLRIGDALNDIGIIYKLTGDYAKSTDYHFRALKIYRTKKDSSKIAAALGNLGNVCEALSKYGEALGYYNEALAISEKLGDRWKIANTQMNIGVIKYYLGKKGESINDFLAALKMFEELNDTDYMTYALTNIGSVYQELGRYDLAVKYLNRSLEISESLDKKWSVANTLLSIGRLYFAMNDMRKVPRQYTRAIEVADQIGAKDLLAQGYKLMSEYYEKNNNAAEALKYFKRFKETSDSLYNENTNREIAEIQAKYETAKKEREIAQLKKDKLKQEFELGKEKNLRNLFIIIAVALLVLGGTLLKYYRDKTSLVKKLAANNEKISLLNEELRIKNDSLSKSQNALEHSNKVKDKFFSILAHDLKNPFGTVVQYSAMLEEEYRTMDEDERLKFISAIKNSSSTIYALFENLLRWSTAQTNLLEVKKVKLNLRRLAEVSVAALALNAKDKNIEIRNNIDERLNLEADPDMIGTVFRNLLSNAIKFSLPDSEIKIYSSENAESHIVTVEDYGTGICEEEAEKLFKLESAFLKTGADGNRGTGLGLLLCREFVSKNGGIIWCESEPGKGSKFIFTIPFENGTPVI